jgi:hypothetical protein
VWILGGVETVVVRSTLIAAALALARLDGPRRRARWAFALAASAAALTVHASVAYVCLVVTVGLFGVRRLATLPPIVAASAGVVAATLGVHAAFFGAGRYGLVAVPFVAALAFVREEEAALR